jgi:hypothetical protein
VSRFHTTSAAQLDALLDALGAWGLRD